MSEPQRFMLDLSELPTGHIPASSDCESEDNQSMANLVQTLAEEFEGDPQGLPINYTSNNRNNVMIASTEGTENVSTEADNVEVVPPTTDTNNNINNNENPVLAANSGVGAKTPGGNAFHTPRNFLCKQPIISPSERRPCTC